MATNPDFLKIMIKDVKLLWPKLDQTYRFNKAEERSEPCAPTVNNAAYSIAWEMNNNDAKALFEALKNHFNDCKARKPNMGNFAKVFGMKKDAEKGVATFTAKRKGVNNAGEVNKPPQVIGLNNLPIEDKAIWSGSVGDVRTYAFATQDPDGIWGISLTFDVVKVKQAIYGDGNLEDDFGAPAEGDMSDFATPKPAPQQTQARPAAKTAEPAPASVPADVAF